MIKNDCYFFFVERKGERERITIYSWQCLFSNQFHRCHIITRFIACRATRDVLNVKCANRNLEMKHF